MKRSFIFAATVLSVCMLLSSCAEKNALKGYEWLEGVWESSYSGSGTYYRVEITKDTYSAYEGADKMVDNEPIAISMGVTMSMPRPVLMLDSCSPVLIHERERCIEFVSSEWGGPWLKKISGPTVLTTKRNYSLDGAKVLAEALNNSGYVAFQFCCGVDPIYHIVLHPFSYCEGPQRGIAYFVEYGLTFEQQESGWPESSAKPKFECYGEYEIIGGVLRVRDIQIKQGRGKTDPRVYDIELIEGKLWLDVYQQLESVPEEIIKCLEKGENCYHM
jgi:hypothetical protein